MLMLCFVLFCFVGLGAGFPVLKKTPRVVRDENSQEPLSQVLIIISECHFYVMLRLVLY